MSDEDQINPGDDAKEADAEATNFLWEIAGMAKAKFSQAARQLDEAAGRVAVRAEKLYDNHNMDDRLTGGALGAKTGALIGLKAGPKGALLLAAAGTVFGIIKGPEGLEDFRAWREKHREGNGAEEADLEAPTADGSVNVQEPREPT